MSIGDHDVVGIEGGAPESAARCRPLRRDAERNRQVILRVAAEVFAERGLDAGFDEIARRAGVGVGTVYRRFPDRDDLVAALFEQRAAEVVASAERLARGEDAWASLCTFIEELAALQVADRGLRQVIAEAATSAERFAEVHERLGGALRGMVERAQAAGDLRPDVTAEDIPVLSLLVSSLSCGGQDPVLWRRYLGVVLDGLRAHRPAATPLAVGPLDDQRLHQVMIALSQRRQR
ncbi:TetR family transcriptional regulator [Modestobacter sp. I12A-02628]|uniref:TetR/AcrR family transcriptional regulator n=1 Tax=Goekera deserti TaxID=2497753 RepID=A0A7K3W9F8_9ACTN|nr:TetR/AcrR family transcriptional regulator [Goekera deserti]MPQ98787.1 TetR family transcriptional regulator [Goekera deserti]NDI49715.1 TetR family transcriptional regulator [Goekera deserti]NEL53092.1 TetR/AcrR family transcriptional regulator [Goekera deserti]